jgi:hypothetical protein
LKTGFFRLEIETSGWGRGGALMNIGAFQNSAKATVGRRRGRRRRRRRERRRGRRRESARPLLLLEKLIVAQLLRKFQAVMEPDYFIFIFTTVCHWSLS